MRSTLVVPCQASSFPSTAYRTVHPRFPTAALQFPGCDKNDTTILGSTLLATYSVELLIIFDFPPQKLPPLATASENESLSSKHQMPHVYPKIVDRDPRSGKMGFSLLSRVEVDARQGKRRKLPISSEVPCTWREEEGKGTAFFLIALVQIG